MAISIVIACVLSSLQAQNVVYPLVPFPVIRNVVVDVQLTHTGIPPLFCYRYGILNGGNSTGEIIWFQIDLSRPSSSVLFDTVGLRFMSPLVEEFFRQDYPPRAAYVVPVGFLEQPTSGGWTGSYQNSPYGIFGTNRAFILPGERKVPFTLLSPALPGIRRFQLDPHFEEEYYFPSFEKDTLELFPMHVRDSIRQAVIFYGWTIGPYAPPAIFDANIVLDTIVSFVTTSRSFGWITDQPTADRYLGYLSSARTHLQQNNIAQARAVLQQVLHRLGATPTKESL